MTRLPTLFISHGSPMHAVDAGGAGQAWRALAESLPRPRAILIASAHWETALPMLTGAAKLETIHDFGGFPDELYKIRYDAPGSPELVNEAATLLRAGHLTQTIAPQRQQVKDLESDGFTGAQTVSEFLTRRELPRGAVLIVDEAGQLGAKQMRRDDEMLY